MLFAALLVMPVLGDAYYPDRPDPSDVPVQEILPELLQSVTKIDISGTERLLVYGEADVHASDRQGRTALHYAAYLGSEELALLLLRSGADPSATDRDGYLPLHLAYPSHPLLARQLSGNGKLLFIPEPGGTSVLEQAVSKGAASAVKLLGDNFIHIRDHDGNSVLHYAVTLGRLDVLRMLINARANVNHRNSRGLLPLDAAFSHIFSTVHAEAAQILIAHYSAPPSETEFLYAYQALRSADPDQRFSEGASVLHLAAAQTHQALLEYFLRLGAAADSRDASLRTPLHLAVEKDHGEIARILLESGASPEAGDHVSDTPLHYAVRGNSSLETLNLLLTHGADPDRQNNDGLSSLHLAAGLPGSEEALSVLLTFGADPDSRDIRGYTPLMLALEAGNKSQAQLLLEHGTDIHIRAYDGRTAAIMMIQLGTKFLAPAWAHDAVFSADKEGNTLLHAAAGMEVPEETLRYLIESGIPVDSVNTAGETPLHRAVKTRNHLAALLLFEHQADPYRKTGKGESALDIAFLAGREFTSRILTRKLTASRGPEGETPLHAAAYANLPVITSLLLEQGADPNAVTSAGTAPLHIAARLDSAALLQVLVRHQARVDLRNAAGNTPLHEAVKWNSSRACRFLLLAGSSANTRNLEGNTPMHTAVLQEDNLNIQTLWEFSASLESRDSAGLTPLMAAVKLGVYETASMLVQLGADINARDSKGSTPLHEAVMTMNESLVLLLADRGSDIHAKNRNMESPFLKALELGKDPAVWLTGTQRIMERDNDGNTPLHLAVKNYAGTGIITALIELGSDVNTRNNYLETPLHLSMNYPSRQAAETLLAAGADMFTRNSDNISPLEIAAAGGLTVLSWIIDESNVHDTDQSGNTPLHTAVEMEHYDAAAFMMKLGADAKAVNTSGVSPKQLAAELGLTDILQLLSAQ